MGIPNETRSTQHLKAFAVYHLAALRADASATHLVVATEGALKTLTVALATREAAEEAELNQQALFSRKDFDLDEATRAVELEVLAASGKNRSSIGYRAAFPRGLSELLGQRGKAQEAATFELTAALRKHFAEVAERSAARLDALATAAADAELAWRSAERTAKTAFVEEQIARSELVRQLHSNRGALSALYPRNGRRVASFFPPSHSRVAGDVEAAEDEAVAVDAKP